MWQQPSYSPPHQCMSFQDSPASTHTHPAPVIGQGPVSPSLPLFIDVPPEPDSHFSSMCLEASAEYQPALLTSTQLIGSASSRTDAGYATMSSAVKETWYTLQPTCLPAQLTCSASSNLVPRASSVTTAEAGLMCSDTSASLPDVSTLLSDSDSLTWTNTVSANFPNEQLVTWASFGFTDLTSACPDVISAPQPAASLSCRHSPRRASLYRPSIPSPDNAAYRPIEALQLAPNTMSQSVAVPLPEAAATSSRYPISISTPLPLPSYPHPFQQPTPLLAYADFHTQGTRTGSTGVSARPVNQLSRGDTPGSARNGSCSGSTDDSSQMAINRTRMFPGFHEAPSVTSSHDIAPVAHSNGVSVLPAFPVVLSLREEVYWNELVAEELTSLTLLKSRLNTLLLQMVKNDRNMSSSRLLKYKMNRRRQIDELQQRIARQTEKVCSLRMNERVRVAQLALLGRAVRSRKGTQSGMHVHEDESSHQQ